LHRRPNNRTKQPPAIHGEYSRDGYEVWIVGRLVYAASNHAHDSTQPAMCEEDRLPLRLIRKFCHLTTREIAVERRGVLLGWSVLQRRRPIVGKNHYRKRKEKSLKWD
jgi:hypothetical protein